jgi:hypothetical protein
LSRGHSRRDDRSRDEARRGARHGWCLRAVIAKRGARMDVLVYAPFRNWASSLTRCVGMTFVSGLETRISYLGMSTQHWPRCICTFLAFVTVRNSSRVTICSSHSIKQTLMILNFSIGCYATRDICVRSTHTHTPRANFMYTLTTLNLVCPPSNSPSYRTIMVYLPLVL